MAAITPLVFQQFTEQTHTGDTNWATALTAGSGSFTGDIKYLLIVQALVNGSTASTASYGARLAHGATPTVFRDSLYQKEFQRTANDNLYTYMTVFTQPSTPVDIVFQHMADGSGNTVYSDEIQIVAIPLTALTENTDYFFVEDTTGADHTTSMVARASKTFTPGTVNDDWLALGHAAWSNNSTNGSTEVDLYDGTTAAPLSRQEGENASDELATLLVRRYTLPASESTIAVRSRDVSGTAATYLSSRLFILNLDVFEDHVDTVADSPVATGTANTYVETATATITPQTAGDWLIIGQSVFTGLDSSTREAGIRLQVDGVSQPASTWDQDQLLSDDLTDQFPGFVSAVVTLATSSTLFDIDAQTGDAAAGTQWEWNVLVGFSMELAAAGSTPVADELQIVHNVQFALGDELQAVHNVLSALGDQLQIVHDIYTAQGDDLQIVHDVWAVAGDQLQIIYDVLASLAAIGKELQTIYDLNAQLTDNLQIVYHINATVADTIQIIHHVQAVVSDTLSPVYNVNELAGDNLQTIFHVLTFVSDTLQTIYDIYTSAGDELQIVHNLQYALADTIKIVYTVLANTALITTGEAQKILAEMAQARGYATVTEFLDALSMLADGTHGHGAVGALNLKGAISGEVLGGINELASTQNLGLNEAVRMWAASGNF